jgi:hypothetical protein
MILLFGYKNLSLIKAVAKSNGTAHFKKCKQLFEYQHLPLLIGTSGGQSSNLYLNVVHFFNTSVNLTSVAA